MFVSTCIIVIISTIVLVKYYFLDVKNNIQDNYNNYSDTDDTEDADDKTEEVNDLDLNNKHKNLIDTIKSINESYDQQK
jgi:cell division protein FtsL